MSRLTRIPAHYVCGAIFAMSLCVLVATVLMLQLGHDLSAQRAWFYSIEVLVGASPTQVEQQIQNLNPAGNALNDCRWVLLALRCFGWLLMPTFFALLVRVLFDQRERLLEKQMKETDSRFLAALRDAGVPLEVLSDPRLLDGFRLFADMARSKAISREAPDA